MSAQVTTSRYVPAGQAIVQHTFSSSFVEFKSFPYNKNIPALQGAMFLAYEGAPQPNLLQATMDTEYLVLPTFGTVAVCCVIAVPAVYLNSTVFLMHWLSWEE